MKRIILIATALLLALTSGAQTPFDAAVNNEDEVVHLEQWQQRAARPLQAIVKLQDYSSYTIVAPKGAMVGQTNRTSRTNQTSRTPHPAIQAVLDSFEVESVEQLCPDFVMPRERRRSASYGGGEVTDHDLSQLYLITLASEGARNEYELIERLAALEEVEYAEPNYLCFALGTGLNQNEKSGKEYSDCGMSTYVFDLRSRSINPADATYTSGVRAQGVRREAGALGDPMYSMQWGLGACGIDSLLTAPKRDTAWRPIIAIIDTGVDVDHPDLADNIWTNAAEHGGAAGQDDDGNGFADDVHGWDFVNQTGEIHDFNSHGTHCAGIAGAVTGNGIGIAGACPDALIMPVTVMQSDGTGDIATIIRGINYAAQNGADVISMSIGTYAYSIAMEQALAVAYQNAVLVAAAGNDGLGMKYCCSICNDMFPGAFTFVLGVQATQQNGGLASFSNYDCTGPSYSVHTEEELYNYELSAPGVGIMSTVPNGQYRNYNGTSMACPLVAGGVASLLQRREYLTKEILFGDLINYSQEFSPVDFWAVYNADSIAPAMLECVAIEINDTAYGDSSMYADAGECLQLYPTIRTVWGPADSVEVWLEFQEFEDTSTLQILQNHVQLGRPISSYAKAKSINPIDIQINSNAADGRHIRLMMCATATNTTDTIRHAFVLEVTNAIKIFGLLSQNDTLWPNKQYLVTGPLGIPSGVTLVIMPGTIIRFENNSSISNSGKLVCKGKPDSLITFTSANLQQSRVTPFRLKDTVSYTQFVNLYMESDGTVGSQFFYSGTIIDCIIKDNTSESWISYDRGFKRCVITQNNVWTGIWLGGSGEVSTSNNYASILNTNIINNNAEWYSNSAYWAVHKVSKVGNCNIFSNNDNYYTERSNTYNVTFIRDSPAIFNSIKPNYFGTSLEQIARTRIKDMYHPTLPLGFGKIDLSNMPTKPDSIAHGIVWKVEVNGYDAQDEFDSIIPLGVGTHEFKVYFNRAMDTSVTPFFAMGVRPPYTQTAISENASWSADSTIYTAHLTLTGRMPIDGLNRIYVSGAQDNEHFEIPYENQRFNVYVSSSGSMSAGFQATPGIGKVDLEWNDQEVNYEDFLGFNIYRYNYDSLLTNRHYVSGVGYVYDTVWGPTDTIRLNQTLVQDTMFTDFDVVPGERYYYYYKILSTSLTENSPSKTVSCVPHSTIPGDANGSYQVDVADVITTINYVTGQNPQPFLFEAADVNGDGQINVLDIVSIINIILYPDGRPGTQSSPMQQTAVYTLENDTLYIDTPVPLSGLQFTLGGCTRSDVEVLPALAGFECATVEEGGQLTMVFYSMSGATVPYGKTALLRVERGEWRVESVALSDPQGGNVIAMDGDQEGLVDLGAVQAQFATAYPNPFSEKVRLELTVGNYREVAITFTDLMGKTVERREMATPTVGRYSLEWDAKGLPRGVYFATLYADGMKAQTIKLIVK